MSRIVNTTKEEAHHGWLMGGNPGAIEAQEKRGQSQLVSSDVLPAKCDATSLATLEAAGVVFGEPVEGDPLFRHAILPAGWKKVATDHDMWSDLVDAAGVVRAEIFYKAAFYDRSAFMRAVCK